MSWFKRFNFFQSVSVGLDIADRSIEVAELVRRGGKIRVAALGRQALPAGIVERGIIKDVAKLTSAVRAVLSLAKPQAIMPHRIHFGLPETQVYLHSFTLPPSSTSRLGAEELRAVAMKEAAENIPLNVDDLLITYDLISGGPLCLLAAASRHALRDWQSFFHSLGFEVEFDLEMPSLFRSLGLKSTPTVAIVDFGAIATTAAVFDKQGLRYSRTLTYGTETLTANLVHNLKITPVEAEKQRQEIGLMDPESKIFTTLLKDLAPLRDELKITFDYYERTTGKKIETLYLAGGGSQLRGLADYLKSNLEIPTIVARSSFLNQPLVYLEALGLALKGFANDRGAFTFELDVSRSGQKSKFLIWPALLLVIGLVVFGSYRYWQNIKSIPSSPVISPEVVLPTIPVATTSESIPTPEPEMITIAQTPTGWLNVRSGAGINFSIVAKVYPGANYPLLEEKGEWYKIELGWVNKQYTIIIINNKVSP